MRDKLTLFLSLFSICIAVVTGIHVYLQSSSTQKTPVSSPAITVSGVDLDENLKIAIVVGVNDYKEQSGVQPLNYSVTDAEEVEKTLENVLGFETMLLRDAQKKIVLETLSQASRKVKERGTLVFFFSGHGLGDKTNDKNYLMLNDSYARYRTELEQTALSMTEIYDVLKAEGVKRAVLFIDACRDNATYLTSKSPSDLSFLYKESSGYHTVYAAEPGKFSYEVKGLGEYDDGGHGAFTYSLNRALRGGAELAADGRLMLRPVIEFIETDIRRVFERPQLRGKIQKPRYSVANGSGDILLGRIANEKMISARSISDQDIKYNTRSSSPASEIEVEHRRMIERIKSLRNN